MVGGEHSVGQRSLSGSVLDYRDRLRLLAINDAQCSRATAGGLGLESRQLDSKTAALTCIAALIAKGGAVPSYGELVDTAFGEGATAAEIVDVLVTAIAIVGLPGVVAEAPKLALALGYDTEEALEQQSGP